MYFSLFPGKCGTGGNEEDKQFEKNKIMEVAEASIIKMMSHKLAIRSSTYKGRGSWKSVTNGLLGQVMRFDLRRIGQKVFAPIFTFTEATN